MKSYYVYILASKPNGTLYIGVTNDLCRRMEEHRLGTGSEFTKQYQVGLLVHYEETSDIRGAIAREKALKKWNREWKLRLIQEENPDWTDLYQELCE